jgi:hypothetical protein
MDKKIDTALKPANALDVAAAIFEGPGEPDTALTFTPELAFLFNGSSEARRQGLKAIDLMMSGVEPDVALTLAFDNLRAAAINQMMN